jgi:predicted enzyme related to lactoylglutathione lyase
LHFGRLTHEVVQVIFARVSIFLLLVAMAGELNGCSTLPKSTPPRDPAVGSLVHFSLPSTDFPSSIRFYSELFGWKFRKMTETYWLVDDGMGALSAEGAPTGSSMPILYFRVIDIDSKLVIASHLGSKILIPKTSAGDGRSFYATLRDPSGNIIGLWSLQ